MRNFLCCEDILIVLHLVCRTTERTKGARCIFPFIYTDKTGHTETYKKCTDVDNNGKLWCSNAVAENGIHETGRWGDCDLSTCKSGKRNQHIFMTTS